jgi:hypothetical protein
VSTAIYKAAPPEGFEWALPVDDRDFEMFATFDGTRRESTWRPVRVGLLHDDEGGGARETSDFPWLGSYVLVLRPRAVDSLGSILRSAGELLPLACDEADLWVLNHLHIVDALDENGSDIVRFSTGRVMTVERWSLNLDRLGSEAIFKVPQLMRGPLLFNESFVEAVAAAGLRGIEFNEVWSGSARRS